MQPWQPSPARALQKGVWRVEPWKRWGWPGHPAGPPRGQQSPEGPPPPARQRAVRDQLLPHWGITAVRASALQLARPLRSPPGLAMGQLLNSSVSLVSSSKWGSGDASAYFIRLGEQ